MEHLAQHSRSQLQLVLDTNLMDSPPPKPTRKPSATYSRATRRRVHSASTGIPVIRKRGELSDTSSDEADGANGSISRNYSSKKTKGVPLLKASRAVKGSLGERAGLTTTRTKGEGIPCFPTLANPMLTTVQSI